MPGQRRGDIHPGAGLGHQGQANGISKAPEAAAQDQHIGQEIRTLNTGEHDEATQVKPGDIVDIYTEGRRIIIEPVSEPEE